jgi:hypothetical protein
MYGKGYENVAFAHTYAKHTCIHTYIQGVGDMYTDPQIHSIDGAGYGKGNMGKVCVCGYMSEMCMCVCVRVVHVCVCIYIYIYIYIYIAVILLACIHSGTTHVSMSVGVQCSW